MINRRLNPEKAEKAISEAGTITNGKSSTMPASKLDHEVKNPLHAAMDVIFQNDESLRQGLSANLKERSTASQAIAERAKVAFSDFSPSKYSPMERARPNYLAPTDNLARTLEDVVAKGVEGIRTSSVKRSIKLDIRGDLKTLIKEEKDKGEGLVGTIALGDLVSHLTLKAGTRLSRPKILAFSSCEAELEAEKKLKEIEGVPGKNGTGQDGSKTPAADSDAKDHTTAKLIADNVNMQMETATSPEAPLRFLVPKRADQGKVQSSIQTFELRAGASDVTSYHDFNSLQIAFEDVWTEIFHGQFAALGQELYQEYVKLKVFSGVDGGADRKINTLEDLQQLMDEIRELSRFTQDAIPTDLQPRGGSSTGGKPKTPEETTDIVKTILDPPGAIVDAIGNKTVKTVTDVLDPASTIYDAFKNLFAGKQKLTWASFPGPLPIGNDIINVTFEEDAVSPGTVEIVLKNSKDAWWWKGLEFWEYGDNGTVLSHFKISNDPRDDDVWSKEQYNILPLYTPQVQNGLLEFQKAAVAGVHTGYYLLSKLDERLKDRTRVTFTWEKD